MQFSLNKKISDKTSQNKDLSQCDIAISQIRGPQKILCTFGEKEHTSKRVSIIACNNAISKVQLTGTPKDTLYFWGKGAHKQKSEHYCLQ